MTDAGRTRPQILVDNFGRFRDIIFKHSTLLDALRSEVDDWGEPILIFGRDVTTEVNSALLNADLKSHLRRVATIADLDALVKPPFEAHEFVSRLDTRLYEHAPSALRTRLREIVSGRSPVDDILQFLLTEAVRVTPKSGCGLGGDFIYHLQKRFSSHGVVAPWEVKDSLLPLFLLAVWLRTGRERPLVFYGETSFSIPHVEARRIAASRLRFEDLAQEAERVFSIKRAEFENGYRVWQLSRAEEDGKPRATTPQWIGLDTARSFLVVLTRAGGAVASKGMASQRPAPLMFELRDNGIGLKTGGQGLNPAIVSAGATTLLRQLDRLKHDLTFGNVVPSSASTITVASEILERLRSGHFNDGDVVQLGLEFNALQWHVDPVRANLSEISIGELVGLFANTQLYLKRFPVWVEFTRSAAPNEGVEHELAAFTLAHDLLREARGRAFLTPDASSKVDEVLQRTPGSAEEPALQEGIVRSGENLLAVTATSLSQYAVREAGQLGQRVVDKEIDAISSGIADFAQKNGPSLMKLALLRDWPWMQWLTQLMS